MTDNPLLYSHSDVFLHAPPFVPDRSPLLKEFEYYLAHQADLLREHQGKFVVIKDQKVIGVYDDELTAISRTKMNHKLGTFLVQKVEPGDSAYTQTYHSRVSLPA